MQTLTKKKYWRKKWSKKQFDSEARSSVLFRGYSATRGPKNLSLNTSLVHVLCDAFLLMQRVEFRGNNRESGSYYHQ